MVQILLIYKQIYYTRMYIHFLSVGNASLLLDVIDNMKTKDILRRPNYKVAMLKIRVWQDIRFGLISGRIISLLFDIKD